MCAVRYQSCYGSGCNSFDHFLLVIYVYVNLGALASSSLGWQSPIKNPRAFLACISDISVPHVCLYRVDSQVYVV